ncbi:MAG: DUF222 domain-containing protein, partial [Bdellovibrionaceae bacterium]|nr:DUF222 domain-containing protein [Pseudobdellovibrionaceae bacterium]
MRNLCMNLKELDNNELLVRLRKAIDTERRISAEVVELLAEIDRRKLYLELGYSSLFALLTEEMGYAPGTAQRRIDAARLLRQIPEIREDLRSGSLNMTQVSAIARAVRESGGGAPQARDILSEARGRSLAYTEMLIAQRTGRAPVTWERPRTQADGST